MAMTTTNRIRRATVLMGASLVLCGAAFASPAFADPVPVPVQLPDCFGEYLPGFANPSGPTPIGRPGLIYAQPGAAFTDGTPGDDIIIGTDGIDFINGLGGNDRICGGRGNDTLIGGFDTIDSGTDVDLIDGGVGYDIIEGGADGDSLYGGIGFDTIRGEAGNDSLFGERGEDYLDCGPHTTADYADGGDDADGPATGHGCETYVNR